jgi:DTW domain-containing protein YfiP
MISEKPIPVETVKQNENSMAEVPKHANLKKMIIRFQVIIENAGIGQWNGSKYDQLLNEFLQTPNHRPFFVFSKDSESQNELVFDLVHD